MERLKDFGVALLLRVLYFAVVLVLVPVVLDTSMREVRIDASCWAGPEPTCENSKGIAGSITLEWLAIYSQTEGQQ